MNGLDGVLTVLPTPFTDDRELDLDSLARLVDFAISSGSRGLVCFGLASELYKLGDAERDAVLATTIEAASGRVPVVAGTESTSLEGAAARTERALAAGSHAVMVLPPTFVKPDRAGVIEYYREVASAAGGASVIVQDAPAWTGVPLPLDVLEEIRGSAPNVDHVKVENPPNAPKIRALVDAGFGCVSGYGAVHVLEDRAAGATALMPGAGDIRDYVALWDAERDEPEAWRIYAALLPLLTFQMSSLDVFIAVQKELLVRAGVLRSAAVRRPGRRLDAAQWEWLEGILERVEREGLGKGWRTHG